ncbi:MAG: hypothetical protein QOJ55_217 [Solirubrobacteraceae bacterium]|nr:hypothetical protein [Solirubrobacteraceae bacterium]
MSLVAHHVLLGLAVAALLGTGFRLASLATPTGLERVLAAVVYAAALAVLEAIALGRFGVGARSLPLGVVAGLTWVTAVLLLPVPEVGAGSELRGAWRRTGTWARVGLGVTGGVGLAFSVWLLRHPSIGLDSNLYHYLEVSRWLHDGGIGGFERLVYGLSYSSYPLTNEVLLAWGSGIARSFVPLALWMPFTLALAGAATWRGLRNLEVGLAPTLLAVAALVTLPLVVRELNEPSNDLPALAWLACTGALCTAAPRRPALLVPAIVAAGLALGSKTTTIVPLAACLGVALWVLRRRLREQLVPLGAALVAALAVGGLWFVRDAVLYGSPFWPHVTVPWGEPKPRFFELVGDRFISRPAATLQGRVDVYLGRAAGGLLLIVAGLLAPLAATRLAGVRVTRGQRRALLGAAAVLALAVLAWASAPVTGLPRATGLARPGSLAESGLRYALPALLTAIVAVALAVRSGGRAATAATVVLAAAVAWNVVELAQLGPPFTPSLLVIVAGAVFGLAVLGAATAVRRALRPRTGEPRRVSGAAAGAALAAVAGGLLAIGATGFVERSSRLAESSSLGRGVVSWFVTRANFAHGHRPIAFATRAPIAALAGDRFNHVLSVVPPFEACDKVRARARAGWVVVTDPAYGYGFLSVDPYSTARCFARRAPGYDDGTFRVYSLR